MSEPVIVVNGVALTTGQAMMVRVAVTTLHAEMSEPGALDDASTGSTGEPLRIGYMDRSKEVLVLMAVKS